MKNRLPWLSQFLPRFGLLTLVYWGLFLPLPFVGGVWFYKWNTQQTAKICNEEKESLRKTFRSLISRWEDSLLTLTPDAVLPPDWISLLWLKQMPQATQEWELATNKSNTLALQKQNLSPQEAQTLHRLVLPKQKPGLQISAISSAQWVFSLFSAPNYWQVLIPKTQATDLLAANSQCGLAIVSDRGENLWSSNSIVAQNISPLWRSLLMNPIGNERETFNTIGPNEATAEWSLVRPGIFLLSSHPASSTDPILWTRATLILGFVLYIIILSLTLPKWFDESQSVTKLAKALDEITNGQLSSRPRLYLTNHLSPLESAIDRAGESVQRLLRDWPTLRKMPKLEVEKVRSLTAKKSSHPVSVFALKLPTSLTVEDYNLLVAQFRDCVERNGGNIDQINRTHATAVWELAKEAEESTPHACMAALQMCVSAKTKNLKLGFGIAAGPASAAWMGAGNWMEYTVISPATHESLKLAEASLLTEGDPLASPDLKEQILTYFVIADETHKNSLEPLRLVGFIDSHEQEVILPS